MKTLVLVLALSPACLSAPGGDDDDSPPNNMTSPTDGFSIDIDQAYQSSGTVSIAPVKESGVFAGFFQAESDPGSTPSLLVSIHDGSGSLSKSSYPCARSADTNQQDETSVLVKWLDGDSYYTNVMVSADCTIRITAMSDTAVSAQISGTIYDEGDPSFPSHSFTASFGARRQ